MAVQRPAETPRPRYGRGVFVAETAYVGGDVIVGDDVAIMHHVTVRGDVAAIRIGDRSNVQDGAVLHTKTGVDMEIEEEVGIGHRAVVHCTRVGRGSLIGIGSIVLDGAVIGAGSLIAAGALVTPGAEIPPGSVVVGLPGRVVRQVTDEDRAYQRFVIERYLDLKARHARGDYPDVRPG